MQEIRLSDINFSSLKMVSRHGSNLATLYTDGDVCYKIYREPLTFNRDVLYKHFMEMSEVKIDGVIMPHDLIMDKGLLQGFSMPLFKDSMTLSDRFSGRYIDKGEVVKAFRKASLILREMHNAGIVCQDLSLENILINSHGDIAYCDPDSFAYKSYYSDSFSKLFIIFLLKYRNTKLNIWEDIDRISMFIAFYYLMFEKEIQKVSKRQYNKLSHEMMTVDNLREIRDWMIDKERPLQRFPYFDEFASNLDVGTLDKNKCLTLGQRFCYKVDRIVDKIYG